MEFNKNFIQLGKDMFCIALVAKKKIIIHSYNMY